MTTHRAIWAKVRRGQPVVRCVRAFYMDHLGYSLGTSNGRKDRGGGIFCVRVRRGIRTIATGSRCQGTRGRFLWRSECELCAAKGRQQHPADCWFPRTSTAFIIPSRCMGVAQGLLHSVVTHTGLQVLDDTVRLAFVWRVVQVRQRVEK